MSSLSDRKVIKQPTCSTCGRCMSFRIAGTDAWVHYCFTDLSEEDLEFVSNQLDSMSAGCIDFKVKYSPRFEQIMMLSEDTPFSIFGTERVTMPDNCCQFYG